MRLRELFEAPERTAAMAFGRMNPPTIGHAKLVDAVKSQGADPYIFLSQSQKPKTDPLSFTDKLRYAKFFFPEVTIGSPEVKTIIQALQKLNQLGYEDLIYVAGSDRVQSFEELINKYNGKDYNFKSIKVVSAGERDPDAEGVEGMSASKLKKLAAEGKLEDYKDETGKKQPGFRSGVPRPEVADEMFAAVRQGMGITDKEPEMAEGWFGFGEGDPLEAPEWLNDENKALWATIQPTTKDKRFITQLNSKHIRDLLALNSPEMFAMANQQIKTELSFIQREDINNG